MCCLPASEAFIILTSFLQSCVDGCHSSATLLAHFCFLWRPFPTIMQIMNNGCPSFGAYTVPHRIERLSSQSQNGCFEK